MKILLVIDSLGFGGAERQLVELIKGLCSKNFEIHLVCLSEDDMGGYSDIVKSLNVTVRYCSRKYKLDLSPVYFLCRYIRENQVELVHTFMNLGSIYGLFAAKITKKKVICSAIRDGKDKNFRSKISKKIFAKFADILVSNSWAGFTNRFPGIKNNFRVVYNGIDFNRFQEDREKVSKLKNELGLNKEQPVIGMIAILAERKDHGTLLEAFKIVLEKFPSTCLLIVGDGPERKKIELKIQENNLEKSIRLLGFRSDTELILHVFDIFVLLTNSTVHLEGISNAIIEAMAVGIPVVASEGGGTNEIISNNVNGYLVPAKNSHKAADAIIELLENKQKAEEFVFSGKRFVSETFSLQRYVDEYITIYKEF